MVTKCPKCSSHNLKKYKYDGVDCFQCSKCGYDSCDDENFPEERTSQREKGRYNPYKAGRK